MPLELCKQRCCAGKSFACCEHQTPVQPGSYHKPVVAHSSTEKWLADADCVAKHFGLHCSKSGGVRKDDLQRGFQSS